MQALTVTVRPQRAAAFGVNGQSAPVLTETV